MVPVLIFGPIVVLCVAIAVALCRAASDADEIEAESLTEIEVQQQSWPHENVLVMAGTSDARAVSSCRASTGTLNGRSQ
jgi:hypothetical protein